MTKGSVKILDRNNFGLNFSKMLRENVIKLELFTAIPGLCGRVNCAKDYFRRSNFWGQLGGFLFLS